MLVRPYDYIIERINGKFFQSDPSFCRDNKRTLRGGSYFLIYSNHKQITIVTIKRDSILFWKKGCSNIKPGFPTV